MCHPVHSAFWSGENFKVHHSKKKWRPKQRMALALKTSHSCMMHSSICKSVRPLMHTHTYTHTQTYVKVQARTCIFIDSTVNHPVSFTVFDRHLKPTLTFCWNSIRSNRWIASLTMHKASLSTTFVLYWILNVPHKPQCSRKDFVPKTWFFFSLPNSWFLNGYKMQLVALIKKKNRYQLSPKAF